MLNPDFDIGKHNFYWIYVSPPLVTFMMRVACLCKWVSPKWRTSKWNSSLYQEVLLHCLLWVPSVSETPLRILCHKAPRNVLVMQPCVLYLWKRLPVKQPTLLNMYRSPVIEHTSGPLGRCKLPCSLESHSYFVHLNERSQQSMWFQWAQKLTATQWATCMFNDWTLNHPLIHPYEAVPTDLHKPVLVCKCMALSLPCESNRVMGSQHDNLPLDRQFYEWYSQHFSCAVKLHCMHRTDIGLLKWRKLVVLLL